MKRDARKALYRVHSVVGAVLGILLFLICVTGAASVFRDELRVWASPRATAGDSSIEIDDVIAVVDSRFSDTPTRFAIRLPGPDTEVFEVLVSDRGRIARLQVDPTTGEVIGDGHNQVADFLFSLHANLTLRGKFGRYLVGALGVAMLLLVVTGLLVHARIFRDFFTMRWRSRAARTTVADAHKATGTWMLLFLITSAFTGGVLGLKDLSIWPALLAQTDGDVGKATALVGRARRTPEPGPAAAMQPVAPMLETARQLEPELVPTFVVVTNWRRARATISVIGSLPGHLLPKSEAFAVTFGGASGAVVRRDSGLEHSGWRRLYDAMTPLHYGDFGGFWVQLIYFVAGVATSMLIWTGLLVWLERRRRNHGATPTEDVS